MSGPSSPSLRLREYLGQTVLVQTTSGRTFHGVLVSFANGGDAFLSNSFERVVVGDTFSDIPLGMMNIAGASLCFIGLVDPEQDAQYVAARRRVAPSAVLAARPGE